MHATNANAVGKPPPLSQKSVLEYALGNR